MALLHVALQDGFANEAVIVLLDGEEVYNKPDVQTRWQIGLADSLDVDVREALVRVEVRLPRRDLAESMDLEVSETTYLGVSITPDGAVSYRVSNEPFGYL